MTGPVLHIDVGISGAQLTTSTSTNITPPLGHIHLYTNNSLTYMNYKPTLDLPVAPGVTYAIYAEFVATDHFPFNPRVKTPTIFVHVTGRLTAGGAANADCGLRVSSVRRPR